MPLKSVEVLAGCDEREMEMRRGKVKSLGFVGVFFSPSFTSSQALLGTLRSCKGMT